MEDVMPWDKVAVPGNTVGEVGPAFAGGEGSPWYVGQRYFANEADAAFWRQANRPAWREPREG